MASIILMQSLVAQKPAVNTVAMHSVTTGLGEARNVALASFQKHVVRT
jgi:hypothetical protein